MEKMIIEKEEIEVSSLEKVLQEKSQNGDWLKDDVAVVILLNKNFNFKQTRTPYDIDICGKKMWEWVSLCVGDCEIKTTVCTDESDILTLIKPYLTDKKWTAVLYSDTPLLSPTTFIKTMEYVRARQANVVKLHRGYIFDTEYAKTAENIIIENELEIGLKNDYYCIDCNQKLYEAFKIIQNRIVDYHISNGIMIEDKNSVKIDSDVIIEQGTIIKQNNSILGMTYIGKNCILEPNDVIKDSVISDNCVIKYSYIDASRISENVIVGPFESIIDKSN